MNTKTVQNLIDDFDSLFDTQHNESLTTWTVFARINSIVSSYEDIDCLMNVNFANGGITQGICIITDWKPGALVFQSDNGELPTLHLVPPEEYFSFMKGIEHIFEPKYPQWSKEFDEV